MMDKKRKSRDENKQKADKFGTKFKSKSSRRGYENGRRKSGPRLPNAFRKELERLNPKNGDRMGSEGDDDSLSENENDLYEYEEGMAEEESKKNRRFDPVENYEYELPEDFKDENVDSEDEDDDYGSGDGGNNAEEEDDGRHLRMLEGITGMPSDAFEEKKKKIHAVIYESYPESEYNPTRDVTDGGSRITVQDLVESLKENPSYTKLQSITKKSHKKSLPLQAPLGKEIRDRVERKAAYELSKKHITNYEPFVKSYREAPTVIFDKDTDPGYSTVGAIASQFKPRTDFEKKMFSLVHDPKVIGAHKEDGVKLLELNKIPVDDYVTYRNHIAKMRSLLFRHEMKSKRIKKIKSKAYHRLLKKDKLKSTAVDIEMNEEAAKELAMKQEFKRAEERLTLRHKKNKFTQRIKERGMDVQDEGTRAALAEQFAEHNRLTRKTNSMHDSSTDDSDSEEDDDNSAGSDHERALKVLEKAKEKTLQVLQDDDSAPVKGLSSLPFMKRALKKRDEAAAEEAKLALQELESSVKHLEDPGGEENIKAGAMSGRWVFGPKKQVIAQVDNAKTNNQSSDTEEELEAREDNNAVLGGKDDSQNGVTINTVVLNSYSGTQQDSFCKSFDVDGESAPRTTYEVAMLVADKWTNMNRGNEADTKVNKLAKFAEPAKQKQYLPHEKEESETDSEEEMVDGILSSGVDKSYKLPSQAELVREAFAGDDVEDEFIKDKEGVLNLENPEPEKPVLLPGWGQWTHIQKKKGLPTWMLEEHESAKRKREETLKTRKDANLKHVIISEKLDKKAEKLHTKTLPYPFTSAEVFEQSIRMPIGPEFNPATAIGALNRPEVVKKPGLVIKPIKFEDVDPYEKADEKEGHKRSAQKPKERIKKSRNKAKPMIVKS